MNGQYPHEIQDQMVQDARIKADQQQIFQEDKEVDQAENGSGRPVAGLVYFAGLTEGPAEDYDTAEAEELKACSPPRNSR